MNIVATFTGLEIARIEDRLSPLGVKLVKTAPLEAKKNLTVIFVQGDKNKSSVINVTEIDPYAYKNDWTIDFEKVVTCRHWGHRIDAFVALCAAQVTGYLPKEKLFTFYKGNPEDGGHSHLSWVRGDEVFRGFGDFDYRNGSYSVQSLKDHSKQLTLKGTRNPLTGTEYRHMQEDEIVAYFNSLPELDIKISCDNSAVEKLRAAQENINKLVHERMVESLLKFQRLTGVKAPSFIAGGKFPKNPFPIGYDHASGEPIGVVTLIQRDKDGRITFDIETSTPLGNGFFETLNLCSTENENQDFCAAENTEQDFVPKKDHDYERALYLLKRIKRRLKHGAHIPAELSDEFRDFLYNYEGED